MGLILLRGCLLLEPLCEPWPGPGPADVLVEDGLIKDVAAKISPPSKAGALEVDLGGRRLLPGLIDLHVHLENEGMDYIWENRQSWGFRALKAARMARETLEAGFTTVRD